MTFSDGATVELLSKECIIGIIADLGVVKNSSWSVRKTILVPIEYLRNKLFVDRNQLFCVPISNLCTSVRELKALIAATDFNRVPLSPYLLKALPTVSVQHLL